MKPLPPGLPERLTPERAIWLVGIAAGSMYLGAFFWLFPVSPDFDIQAYYVAGRFARLGEPFVGWNITSSPLLTDKAYVYTPITVLVFMPYGLLPSWAFAYVLHLGILILALLGVGLVTLRLLEREGLALDGVDRWLVVGFCVLSIPAVLPLSGGNIDPIALLALAVGLLAIEDDRGRLGGGLWSLVALFKLFPAFLGIWLVHRRAYRAIGTAVAVGVGATLLGLAIFGLETHLDFVEFIIEERSREEAFDGVLDPNLMWITLRRPLSHLGIFGGHGLTVLATLIVAPLVLRTYVGARTTTDHLVTYLATLVALLISVVPSTLGYMVYVYVPAIALVYLVRDHPARWFFLAGIALLNLPIFPRHVAGAVDALGAGSAGEAIVEISTLVMSFASLPLIGMVTILGGCVVFAMDRPDRDDDRRGPAHP